MINLAYSLSYVAQLPKSGLGWLVVEVSRSYTIRYTHTRPAGFL